VVIPTSQHERNLAATRLAADVMGISTLVVARADAESARLIASDVDARDLPFIEPDSRTPEGFFRL
jgi:isocitrate lyase